MALVRGTPSWLRATNDKAALRLLLDEGPLTRSRLQELTELSGPTASKMIARLESSGLIEVCGEVSGKRGPNAQQYRVRTDTPLGVAVSLTDARAFSCVVDVSRSVYPVAEIRLPRTARGRSAHDDVTRAMDAALEAAGRRREDVGFVGVALQAAVDPVSGDVRMVSTLPGWERRGVAGSLSADLGLHVELDNDVNLAALAERAVGAGQGLSDFVLLWLGAGLGITLDVNGAPYRGASGGAGEIGYLPVGPDNVQLTDLVGSAAVVRLARQHGLRAHGFEDCLMSLARAGAAQLDPIWSELAGPLACAIVPVCALLDPSVVIIGGPLGEVGGKALVHHVRARVQSLGRWRPKLAPTGVDGDAVLLGARTRLEDRLRDHLFDRLAAAEYPGDPA